MPFSSTDIAALTGGFSQQVMLQQQQAAMISNQFGGYAPSPFAHPVAPQGEQFAGMLMQGMGGMGMSAMGSQRLNSMGGGIAAPFTQSGQMLMGQMMYGAQQQQMLDVNLRQAYRFPNAFGGRGFTGTDTGMIGSNLRQMSHMRGPSGETTSFEELGQLASNMGRMGMAEGVRSVKDFNEKFKQMLNTVKTIATELGTSLEEAQKVMASMKGSGIFSNQGQFAGMIRKGAIAGNVSTAEMSSAALMGAQISRSVGGRGRAGAFAGVSTMSNIGAATQAGILSEEDIYNVTGLTGAEGRQAMAQNMMAGDARFFSGGLGRRVLASIAGKNGSVNEEDVMSYMSGGVSTGETMSMARRNLGKVGRANFIRNEGRLRGEAMAAFGGLGKAVVARNWLEERGMDMNEMDDRSMLFFQRKFGVGRDEADQLIKMARNMDNILGQRQRSSENDQYVRRLDKAERASSPEEIVKRLEMARNQVNDGLREVGASFYKSMSISIGEFVSKLSGEYVQRRRGAMASIVNQMMRGGPGTDDMMARELGITVGPGGRMQTAQLSSGASGIHSRLFGSGQLTGEQFSRYVGANAQQFREAGYDISGARSMADINGIQQRAFQGALGFATGTGNQLMGEGTTKTLRGLLANGGLTGRGGEFASQFEGLLGRAGDKGLLQRFQGANAEERGRMMRDILEQAGVAGEFSDRMRSPTALGARGSAYSTLQGENVAIGDLIMGNRSRFGAEGPPSIAKGVRALGGDASSILGGQSTLAGRTLGRLTGLLGGAAERADTFIRGYAGDTEEAAGRRGRIAGALGRIPFAGDWLGRQARGVMGEFTDVDKAAVGEFLKGDEARGMAGTLLTGDARAQEKQLTSIQDRRIRLANRRDRSRAEGVELEGLRALEAMGRIRAAGAQPSKEQLAAIAKDVGYGNVQSMLNAAGGAEATAIEEQRRDRAQAFEGMGMRAQEDLLARAESDKAIDEGLRTGDIKVGAAARSYRDMMRKMRSEMGGFTGDSSELGDAANVARYGRVRGMQQGMAGARAQGSIEDRRRMARELAQLGESGESARMMAEVRAEERLTRGARRGTQGTLEAVASSLGADFSKGDFKGLSGAAGVQEIMNRLGLGEGSTVRNRGDIEKEISAIVSDKGLSGAQRGQRLAALQGRQELVEGQREQQTKQAEQRDPSFRRLGEIKEALGTVDKSIGRVANVLSGTLTVKMTEAGEA